LHTLVSRAQTLARTLAAAAALAGDCTMRAAIELSDASGRGSTIRLNLPTPGQSWRFA